jgi:predicted RNase H-like HicB family nuclease
MASARQGSSGRANLKEYRFDTARSDEPAATRRLDRAVGQGPAYGLHQGRPGGCRIEPQGRYQTWDTPLDLPRSQLGLSAETVRDRNMGNYIAIAEPSDDGKIWWISFPGFPGVTSAADRAEQIAGQARDALSSAVAAGAPLPRAVEDGEIPAYDLSEYSNPLVLLVSYVAQVPAAG